MASNSQIINNNKSIDKLTSSLHQPKNTINIVSRNGDLSTTSPSTSLEKCDNDDLKLSTPGMSENIASLLPQIKNSAEDVDYAEHRVTLLPSETNNIPSPDLESLNDNQKATSKQVFPYIACLPFENNVVFCFVLSAWDNIVGPQTIYVWKKKSLPNSKNFEEFVATIEKPKSNLRIKQKRRSSLGQGMFSEDRRPSFAEEVVDYEKSITDEQVNVRDVPNNNLSSIEVKDNNTSQTTVSLTSSAWTELKPVINVNLVSEEQCTYNSTDTSLATNNKSAVLPQFNIGLRRPSICEEVKVDSKLPTLDNTVIKEEETLEERVQYMSLADISEQTSSDEDLNKRSNVKTSVTNISRPMLASSAEEKDNGRMKRRGKLNLATVVKYVTEHSVGVGELGRAYDKLTTSLLMVPHHSIIVVAARFTIVEEGLGVPYCLSMVIPLEEQEYIMPLVEFITNSLLRSAAVARLLITKNGLEGGGAIKQRLVELCEILVALRKASLDQYPLSPAGKPPEDRRVAELLLTSHLQTMGTTLVIADSPTSANKVVMWLGQYSRPEDLHVSRLCLSFIQWPYHPGLAIQGVVRNIAGEANLSSQDLISSHRPLTVVDLTHGSVRQTLHTLSSSNVDTFRQELLGLWHDISSLGSPSQSLLTPVKTVAPLVRKFLHDLDQLGSCDLDIKQYFICSFLRSLQYTALALITWVQHEWVSKKKHGSYSSIKQALMSVFMLELADLQILVAQAEYLQPGFYSIVMS